MKSQPTENYHKLPSLKLVAAMAQGLLAGGRELYQPPGGGGAGELADHAYDYAQAIMDKHLAELNAAGWDIDEDGCHFEIEAETKQETKLDASLALISDNYITREQVLEYLGQLSELKGTHPVSFTVLRHAICDLYDIADAVRQEKNQNADKN